MSGQSLGNVGKFAIEDAVEDFLQSFWYKRVNEVTKPLKDKYKGESELDEFMQNFISTLSSGLIIYAFSKTSAFFFDRGIKLSTYLWTYIIAGKMKKKLLEKLKKSKFKGTKAFRTVALVLDTDRTSDRIEVAKMVQENVKSYDNHKFHYQNQYQKESSKVDSLANGVAGYKGSVSTSNMTLFMDLTSRGAWLNTTEHKKIYEMATGTKLKNSGNTSWSVRYEELNKHTQFHKTVNGDIENLTTAINKLVGAKG